MCNGSDNLLTCWIPLQDIGPGCDSELDSSESNSNYCHGGLAVLPGSNHLPCTKKTRETYGSLLDVRKPIENKKFKGSGWLSDDDGAKKISDKYAGGHDEWVGGSGFRMGDVVIFTQHTMHMSAVNQMKYEISDYNSDSLDIDSEIDKLISSYRLSCDTRWLRTNEKADGKYMLKGECRDSRLESDSDGGGPKEEFGLAGASKDGLGGEGDEDDDDNTIGIEELKRIWALDNC